MIGMTELLLTGISSFQSGSMVLPLALHAYSILYFIDKERISIVVTTIFHHKRNPGKKYPG